MPDVVRSAIAAAVVAVMLTSCGAEQTPSRQSSSASPSPSASPTADAIDDTRSLMDAMAEAGHPCLDETLLGDDALGACSGGVLVQGALTEQEASDFAEDYTIGEGFGAGVGTVVIGTTPDGTYWGIAAGTPGTAAQYADALGGTIY